MTDQQLHQIPVESIIPFDKNPKIHPPEQIHKLCLSIREFGFTAPIIVTDTYELLAGHGRLIAAKQLGMATVPCVVLPGLTLAQKKSYVIADNKISEMAEYDTSLLFDLVKSIEMEQSSLLEMIGLQDDELSLILKQTAVSNAPLTTLLTDEDYSEFDQRAQERLERIESSDDEATVSVTVSVPASGKTALLEMLSSCEIEGLSWQ